MCYKLKFLFKRISMILNASVQINKVAVYIIKNFKLPVYKIFPEKHPAGTAENFNISPRGIFRKPINYFLS